MARRKRTQKHTILRVAFLAFTVYVVVSFTIMQIDIAKRKEELASVQSELKEQEYIKSEITDILNSGENTEYIMKIAREKLGFAFQEEEIYVDPNRKE